MFNLKHVLLIFVKKEEKNKIIIIIKQKEKMQQSEEPYNLNELHIFDHTFDYFNELNVDFKLSHYTKNFSIEKLSNFIYGVYYFIKWYQKKKLAVSNNCFMN